MGLGMGIYPAYIKPEKNHERKRKMKHDLSIDDSTHAFLSMAASHFFLILLNPYVIYTIASNLLFHKR